MGLALVRDRGLKPLIASAQCCLFASLVLSLVCGLIVPSGSLAAASGADLVVSTFDVDEAGVPGTTIVRSVRVTNRGTDPLTVRLEPRSVHLLDDGKTRFDEGEDPVWAGDVTLSTNALTLPPGVGQNVAVRVRIPPDMPPDDYILGVLVSPVPAANGDLQIVNAIGALISINVLGDRLRSLELVGHSLPGFVVGDQVTGTVRVKDTGTTLVSPWLEATAIDALLGAQVADIQVRDQNRIGPGASRDLTYTWNAGMTVGKFRVPVRIFYNRDNSTSAELDVEEELWLVHPAILIGLVLLVLAGIGALGFLVWRRRRARRSAIGQTAPQPPPATPAD